jgi:aspartyl-tRNA(Asn)/glutamyl-tRNA(Gln) amidotransferase subunit B
MLLNNPVQVAQFKEGKQQVLGYLVGQAMKASGGKANPSKVNELLKKKLG